MTQIDPVADALVGEWLSLPDVAARLGLPISRVKQLLRDRKLLAVNRPSGDRTAPYWRHVMVIDIYAAMEDGVWLYEPKSHTLQAHLAEDIRAATGLQDFVGIAPLNLVYVAHGERMTDISAEDRRLYASVDTGFIGQNSDLRWSGRHIDSGSGFRHLLLGFGHKLIAGTEYLINFRDRFRSVGHCDRVDGNGADSSE